MALTMKPHMSPFKSEAEPEVARTKAAWDVVDAPGQGRVQL